LEYLCYLLHIKEGVLRESPGSILDVGCGDGRFLSLIPEVEQRVGVDMSARAIELASAITHGVDFRCQDVAAVAEQFDVVTSIEVLEHIPDDVVASFITGLGERCRSGGLIAISVPSKFFPVSEKHFRHYDEALLREQLRPLSGVATIERIEYVYGEPKALTFAQKLLNNRWWTFDSPVVRKALWKHLWDKRRVSNPGLGRHVVAWIRKH
jgi:2-polyprenyl-3-methyl-5-hydroxy-6-metoxy-1,4-benzoquinol methylase